MGVTDLERYATAYYVSETYEEKEVDEIAAKIVELKPHISRSEAQEAVLFIYDLRSDLSD